MEETSHDTKTRILEATERLFMEQGLEAISLRAVTAKAGVNIAAVNYHFGSKSALLEAMVRRILDLVTTEQLRLLQQLEQQHTTLSVLDLLTAYAVPIFKMSDTYRGQDWGPVFMYARPAMRTPSSHTLLNGMRDTRLEDVSEVTRRYCQSLQHVLPDLSSDELLWRFNRTSNLLMANQGKQMTSLDTSIPPDIRLIERARLLTYVTGALEAPPTLHQSLHEKLTQQIANLE